MSSAPAFQSGAATFAGVEMPGAGRLFSGRYVTTAFMAAIGRAGRWAMVQFRWRRMILSRQGKRLRMCGMPKEVKRKTPRGSPKSVSAAGKLKVVRRRSSGGWRAGETGRGSCAGHSLVEQMKRGLQTGTWLVGSGTRRRIVCWTGNTACAGIGSGRSPGCYWKARTQTYEVGSAYGRPDYHRLAGDQVRGGFYWQRAIHVRPGPI